MSRKKHIYKRPPEEYPKVKVKKRLIPQDLPNRIGTQKPSYIVIHEVSLGTGRSPIRFGDEKKKANPKQCPGRLLGGFRGNLEDFKTEIKRCFIYGWFFEELLDQKTIDQIPDIQKKSKERFLVKKEKGKKVIGLENLDELWR